MKNPKKKKKKERLPPLPSILPVIVIHDPSSNEYFLIKLKENLIIYVLKEIKFPIITPQVLCDLVSPTCAIVLWMKINLEEGEGFPWMQAPGHSLFIVLGGSFFVVQQAPLYASCERVILEQNTLGNESHIVSPAEGNARPTVVTEALTSPGADLVIVVNPFSLLGEGAEDGLALINTVIEDVLADFAYDDDDLLDDDLLAEHSFQSMNSGSSFVRKIGLLEVSKSNSMPPSKDYGSSKRKLDESDDVDTAPTSLKRSRT